MNERRVYDERDDARAVVGNDDDDAMCDDCGTIGTAYDVDGATCYVCDDCGASWLYVQRATPRDCGDASCALWHTCAVYAALRALPRAHIYDADVRGVCAVNDADNDDAELRAWAARAPHVTRCDVCDDDDDVCDVCHVCVRCTAHDATCADAVPCAACNGNVLAMWRAQRRDNAA